MDLEFYKIKLYKAKEYKNFWKISKKPPKNLDYLVQEVHDEVFRGN